MIVPSLNDELLANGWALKEKDIPIPSSAAFASQHPKLLAAKPSRPSPLKWTPELLDHFVKSFLLPLRQSRTFSLSLTFSGPKPDPFIDLPPPAPLPRHLNSPKPGKIDATRDHVIPVRPEAGDHLRIYCDAREALSLRTWLNGVALDSNILGETGAVVGAKPWKLFDKVRLCLVGELGEVLIIA